MNNTIAFALEKNIIVGDEKDELVALKNKFRNPYSHAEMNSIIKNISPTFSGFIFDFKDVENALSLSSAVCLKKISLV